MNGNVPRDVQCICVIICICTQATIQRNNAKKQVSTAQYTWCDVDIALAVPCPQSEYFLSGITFIAETKLPYIQRFEWLSLYIGMWIFLVWN